MLPASPTWSVPTTVATATNTPTLTGTNLGTSGTVQWRGRFPWTVTAWSPTSITVSIPATARGEGELWITPATGPALAVRLNITPA